MIMHIRDLRRAVMMIVSLFSYRLFSVVSTLNDNTTIPPPPLIVVAPTFYTKTDHTNDIRFALGMESCRQAAQHGVPLLVIDGSPDHETVKAIFELEGTDPNGKSWVQVVKQTYVGGKGAALKEGIAVARQQLMLEANSHHHHPFKSSKKQETETFIALQEPEKTDMFHFWNAIGTYMVATSSDIVVPERSDALFQQTYPTEQYHSERFGNLYLNSLGQKVGFPAIDWLMGPIIFRTSLASHWLSYDDGDLWDVQLIPMIRAWESLKKTKPATTGSTDTSSIVASFPVEYHHPATQKQEEDGVSKWSEKRLRQLDVLFDMVGKELKKHESQ